LKYQRPSWFPKIACIKISLNEIFSMNDVKTSSGF
jgi:hypothetical protein